MLSRKQKMLSASLLTLSIAGCSDLSIKSDELFIPCMEVEAIYTNDSDSISEETYNYIDEFNVVYEDLC